MALLGAEELRIVAAACRREANDRLIINDLNKEIRRKAGKSIREEVRAACLEHYPREGGLNVWLAKSSVRLVILRGWDTAGVKVIAGKRGHDLKRIDSTGQVRHPVFGNRNVWTVTNVQPGVISNAISNEGRDILEDAVLEAAEAAARRIVHGI